MILNRTMSALLAGVLTSYTCLCFSGDEQWEPPQDLVERIRLINEIQTLALDVFLHSPYPVSKRGILTASREIESVLTYIEVHYACMNQEEEAGYYFGALSQDLNHALAVNYYRASILEAENGDEIAAENSRAISLTHLKASRMVWTEDELRSFVISDRFQRRDSCCDASRGTSTQE